MKKQPPLLPWAGAQLCLTRSTSVSGRSIGFHTKLSGLPSGPAGRTLFQKRRDPVLCVGGHQVHGHDLFGVAVSLVLIQVDLVVKCLLAALHSDAARLADP